MKTNLYYVCLFSDRSSIYILGTGPAQDLVLVFPRSCTRIATKILFGLFWFPPRFTKNKIWDQDLVWVKIRSLIHTRDQILFWYSQDLVQDLVWSFLVSTKNYQDQELGPRSCLGQKSGP